MDWRGWGRLLERQQLAIKERKRLSNVCWFTRALSASRGAKPIDDHASWMTAINVSQQPLGACFYPKHHNGALSANICKTVGPDETETQGRSGTSWNVFSMLLLSITLYVSKVITLTFDWIMHSIMGMRLDWLLSSCTPQICLWIHWVLTASLSYHLIINFKDYKTLASLTSL